MLRFLLCNSNLCNFRQKACGVTYYSVSSVLQIFKMHSLNVPSQQKILGFDGDEFTFNNLNRIMKIIAKTARKVVDIFNCFSLLRKQQNFTPDFDSNSIFTSASSWYAFLSTTRLDVSDNFDSSEVFLRSPWENEKIFELNFFVLFGVTPWGVDRVVQFLSSLKLFLLKLSKLSTLIHKILLKSKQKQASLPSDCADFRGDWKIPA